MMARIRLGNAETNGIELFIGGKYVPCSPEEAKQVLHNVTEEYPVQSDR